MIIYVKQLEEKKLMYTLFNILKAERIADKAFINLPINKNSSKRKIEKVFEKLGKYLYNNNIKNVVLEKELMQNEMAKNILYSNNINILEGTMLKRYLIYNVVQKIYQYKNKKIEAGEITLLINENDEINIETIKQIVQNVKRLNIITSNTKRFRKIVDYLYNELGILIKLTNNLKTNLNSTDIIINIDFPEEIINKLDIPTKATILNIQEDININTKKFAGINIKTLEIQIPKEYELEKFDARTIYEASLYKKPTIKIFEQIQEDNLQIKHLIGVNGIINPLEFI